MPVRPYLRRFVRKIVFEVVPGTLASLIGTVLVAQYWSQPQRPARLEAVAYAAPPGEQIVAMIRDEHAVMMDFLRQEQAREIARQPLSVKDMKAKDLAAAAVTPARRSAEAVREKPANPPQAQAAAPLPPAKPEVEIVAVESGPLTAPEPQPVGTFGRITAIAGTWTNKAIDLTGLRVIPALIRSIPERADLIGGGLGATAGGGLVSASR